MRRLQWSDADRFKMRFRGHKGDQAQAGSVVVRTRSEVRGPCSELCEGGGAVALMIALLLSCFVSLLEHAPFKGASKSVGMWSGVTSVERDS